MRYRIAYDQPGRLRVRFGPDAFTQEQGYGIAALLLGRPGVREAVTCALNGSVLVCYEGEGRAEALAVVRGLRRDALPVGTAADDDQLRQVDSQFLGRLLSMAARHFLKKWFLPFPVRCAVTLWNAAGYWREVNGHPVGYFIFFLLCQFVPLPVLPFGELCIRINNSQLSHPFASCFTNFIPPFLTIDLREFLNIFFFCLQRPVRSVECQI